VQLAENVSLAHRVDPQAFPGDRGRGLTEASDAIQCHDKRQTGGGEIHHPSAAAGTDLVL
jgi:hypothetical protein